MTRTSNQIENMVRESNHIWDNFITKYLLYTEANAYSNYEGSSLTIDSTIPMGDTVEVGFTYHDYENNEYTNYTTTLPVESIKDWIEGHKEDITRYHLLSELCPLGDNDTVTVHLNCGWYIQAFREDSGVSYNFYNCDGCLEAEVSCENKKWGFDYVS